MNILLNIVAKRIALGCVTLIVISLLIFLGVELLPGDVAEAILGQEATQETVEAFRKELKLDLPPHVRYFNWLGVKERMNAIDGVEVGKFDSVSLSFTSMFKFLGLQRLHFGAEYIQALHWSLELLTAVQTLGGIVFLFFLGLGLRTRFRLS